MAAPKLKQNYQKLYQGEGHTQNLHDKKIIESLQKRLNEMIQKDPEMSKKAALIIENWIKKNPKP